MRSFRSGGIDSAALNHGSDPATRILCQQSNSARMREEILHQRILRGKSLSRQPVERLCS